MKALEDHLSSFLWSVQIRTLFDQINSNQLYEKHDLRREKFLSIASEIVFIKPVDNFRFTYNHL